MSDFLILGSGGDTLNPEGAVAWDRGVEAGNFATVVTRAFSPQGLEGDALFRRVYVTVEHDSGISLAVVPILDGQHLLENAAFLSRPSPPVAQDTERFTFVVPIFTSLSGRVGSVGARGTTMQLEISAHAPTGDWWIENIGFMIAPGTRAKVKN